jgi:hypothetical protein
VPARLLFGGEPRFTILKPSAFRAVLRGAASLTGLELLPDKLVVCQRREVEMEQLARALVGPRAARQRIHRRKQFVGFLGGNPVQNRAL